MNNIKSSFFIWFITTVYFILNFSIGSSIISLVALGIIGYLYIVKKDWLRVVGYVLLVILIFYDNRFMYYIPLVLYGLLDESIYFNSIKIISITVLSILVLEKDSIVIYLILLLTSLILKYKDVENWNLQKKYGDFIIDSKEKQINLQMENNRLIEAQDKGIKLAISNERNRIARDIHDGVGHIISRTILQIGAILVVEKDENKKEDLENIKNSLTESMTELRRSLHNLQENTINLKSEIEKTVSNYSFSEVIFNYSLDENKDLNFKYSIIYIVNECLNNIIKHSNAKVVEINLRETDNNIFILIKDDGTKKQLLKYGIGLNSIEARVKTINGNLQISNDNGFRVFINIEKEEL